MAFSGKANVPDVIALLRRKFVGAAKEEIDNGQEAVLPEKGPPEMLAMAKPFTLSDCPSNVPRVIKKSPSDDGEALSRALSRRAVPEPAFAAAVVRRGCAGVTRPLILTKLATEAILAPVSSRMSSPSRARETVANAEAGAFVVAMGGVIYSPRCNCGIPMRRVKSMGTPVERKIRMNGSTYTLVGSEIAALNPCLLDLKSDPPAVSDCEAMSVSCKSAFRERILNCGLAPVKLPLTSRAYVDIDHT